MFANLDVTPGIMIAWLIVGLLSGALSAWLLKRKKWGMLTGYFILGMLGAVIGGSLFQYIVHGEERYWGSMAMALVGAHLLIAVSRFMGFGRQEC